MDIVEVLRNKIELLQEQVNRITEDNEHLRAKEWHYYKLGVNYGEKIGQLHAYKEILELLELKNR